jgi:hypothetical protein
VSQFAKAVIPDEFTRTEMNTKFLPLIAIAGLAVISTFLLLDPIPQGSGYHQFADNRSILGIANGMDVISNLPFIIVGAWGIIFTAGLLKKSGFNSSIPPYLIFFIGIFFTGLGSTVYHSVPSNATLVWDRLPLTITFMGFFCSVISELISRRAALILLLPLLLVGLGSAVYWAWSESLGRGDLRPYGLVQFLPMLLIPLIFILYKLPGNYLPYTLAALVFYFISKVAELLDEQIFRLLQVMSGHTIKHVLAAAGTCCILLMLYKRRSQLTSN